MIAVLSFKWWRSHADVGDVVAKGQNRFDLVAEGVGKGWLNYPESIMSLLGAHRLDRFLVVEPLVSLYEQVRVLEPVGARRRQPDRTDPAQACFDREFDGHTGMQVEAHSVLRASEVIDRGEGVPSC